MVNKIFAAAALAVFAAGAAASAVSDLTDFSSRIRTARGDFTQTVVAADGKAEPSQTGSFSFQKPGQFFWHYQKPYEQKLVSDGKVLWVYDADLAQVTVTEIPKGASSPAAILVGGDVAKDYVLTEQPPENGLSWVRAVPCIPGSQFSEILVGMDGKAPRELRIKDTFGVTTRVEFTKLEPNARVSGAEFHFQPPQNTDVINQIISERRVF